LDGFRCGQNENGEVMSLFEKIKKILCGRAPDCVPVHSPANVREGEWPEEIPIDPDNHSETEISEQIRIQELWKNEFREYIVEAHGYRMKYSKSCKCDVCGAYTEELFLYQEQTYCVRHLPVERTVVERKVMAGSHGSARSFLKRIK
jgi:hypothetical protein